MPAVARHDPKLRASAADDSGASEFLKPVTLNTVTGYALGWRGDRVVEEDRHAAARKALDRYDESQIRRRFLVQKRLGPADPWPFLE
jgi:hypothetical protein